MRQNLKHDMHIHRLPYKNQFIDRLIDFIGIPDRLGLFYSSRGGIAFIVRTDFVHLFLKMIFGKWTDPIRIVLKQTWLTHKFDPNMYLHSSSE